MWGEGCSVCDFLLIGWWWGNRAVLLEILCSAWNIILPLDGGPDSAEGLKGIVMHIPWVGTRTMPQVCTTTWLLPLFLYSLPSLNEAYIGFSVFPLIRSVPGLDHSETPGPLVLIWLPVIRVHCSPCGGLLIHECLSLLPQGSALLILGSSVVTKQAPAGQSLLNWEWNACQVFMRSHAFLSSTCVSGSELLGCRVGWGVGRVGFVVEAAILASKAVCHTPTQSTLKGSQICHSNMSPWHRDWLPWAGYF